jgi:hypothetical protein
MRIVALDVDLLSRNGSSAEVFARLREMATTLLSLPGLPLHGGTNEILRGAISRGLGLS